jgi:hypothetical protein
MAKPFLVFASVTVGLTALGVGIYELFKPSSAASASNATLTPSGSTVATSSAPSGFASPVNVPITGSGLVPPITVLGYQSAANQGNGGAAPSIDLYVPDGAFIQDITSSDDTVLLAPSFSGGPGTTHVDLGSAGVPGTVTLTITWYDITNTPETSTLNVTVV